MLTAFHSWKGITDRADLVLLMEEGTIKEEGTHRSLMEKDGGRFICSMRRSLLTLPPSLRKTLEITN